MLIVGAGPAGAAAACVLAARHSVVLVERHATPPFRIGESLIGAARPLLRDLGVLEQFEAAGHRPGLGQASVWGSDELVRRDSFLDPRGPGWRIERAGFETMLRDTAASRGASVIAPGEIFDLRRENDAGQGWNALIGSAGRTWPLHARFLIDASGRAARFARAAAQAQIAAHDRLICRFVHLAPRPARGDLDGFSLVEAIPDGWWYSARLPDGSTVIAFHADADLPAARLSLKPEGFFDLLTRTRWTAAAARTLVRPARSGAVRRADNGSKIPAAATGAWSATPQSHSIRCHRRAFSTRCTPDFEGRRPLPRDCRATPPC